MFQEETRRYIQEKSKKPNGTPITNWKVLWQQIPWDNQEDTDVSESEDSFCLQMQIKK